MIVTIEKASWNFPPLLPVANPFIFFFLKTLYLFNVYIYIYIYIYTYVCSLNNPFLLNDVAFVASSRVKLLVRFV